MKVAELGYEFKLAARKVSIVLRLIDTYTGLTVAKGAQVVINKFFSRPIIKPDGYYVFTNLPAKSCEIIVESKNYFPVKTYLAADDELWSEKNPILNIYLIPNKYYNKSPVSTFIWGKLEPNIKIYAVPVGDNYTIRLSFYQNGFIKLATSYPIKFLYRHFSFVENNIMDNFALISQTGDSYELNRKLDKKYLPGTGVYPLSLGQTDCKGDLYMPLWGVFASDNTLLLLIGNEYTTRKLDYGTGNVL